MTPAARVQAAIEILDAMAGGLAAEQALTRWARGARYAGSKDRAAVRDHVFSVLRGKRSCAALGGGENGRALMLGRVRAEKTDPETIFTGEGHAPATLTAQERDAGATPEEAESRDLPDWLWARFKDSLGEEDAVAAAEALRHRAPVCLRHNPRMKSAVEVMDMLEQAIKDIKEGKEPSLQQSLNQKTEVELGVSAIIPDDYIGDVATRLSLYKRIASAKTKDELDGLQVEFIDRFGILPEELKNNRTVYTGKDTRVQDDLCIAFLQALFYSEMLLNAPEQSFLY